MTSSADLASLYQLLATRDTPTLPSGERRAILGCGYVGEAVAQAWKQQGHELWGTTTRPERLTELANLVDNPLIFDSTDSRSDLSFTQDLDGILVSFAPSKTSNVDLRHYQQTYLQGVELLLQALQQRPVSTPLQLVYLSSCGVYGNRQGAVTGEDDPTDTDHPINAVLVRAEEMISSLRSEHVNVCILRLGGIYGPGRDIPATLLGAAGGLIQRNGLNVPCWIHRDDIISGVDFAFARSLNDTFNLVNDTQFNGQELTDRLCEQAGLPFARWLTIDTADRVLNARVSNAKLKHLGFRWSHRCLVG